MDEVEAAALLGVVDAGKQMVDMQSVHRSPNMELVHCAREAAFTAKASAQLAATTKVDTVKDAATAASNAAKHTEFLARKLACRLGLPVQTGEPFLPTLAKSQTSEWMLAAVVARDKRYCEFI